MYVSVILWPSLYWSVVNGGGTPTTDKVTGNFLTGAGTKYRYCDCTNITSMGLWIWTTYWDLVQFNVASTLVCVFHEFLRMLVLFGRGVFEELGYSVEGDVMASEEMGLGWGESRGKLLLPFRQF